MLPMTRLSSIVFTVSALAAAAGHAAAEQSPAPLLDRVTAALAANAADMIALRRDLHRNPEPSGKEERTARVVADRLRALGLDVRTGVGGHGIVAVLKGGRPGPLVAYRADMDAVPSTAPDPVDYRSLVPGVRHICGHDLHTATAVALAAALASVRAELPGSVMFVMQPAEETAAGAKAMLAGGIFAQARPVAIYGIHTAPYEVGQIGTRPGVMMPARDRLRITIAGDGDQQAAETAARAAAAALSTIAPAQAVQPAPPDFSFVQLGPRRTENGATVLQGTVTVASAAGRERVRQGLARALSAIALPGVTVTHDYEPRWIAGVTNDAALTASAVAALERAVGKAAVQPPPDLIPAFSEDFGSFQEQVPGVFFFLGVSNTPKGIAGMPHSPGYVADDDAIAFGARAMAAVLLERMMAPQPK
jgi:amidohydrolase